MTASWELRKFVAPEFVFGVGAVDLAGQYARNFAAHRALLVTDSGVHKSGWAGRVAEGLRDAGIEVSFFSDLSENPKASEVMTGARFYRESRSDIIVAVGGGSPMDCAKGIGIVAVHGRRIEEFEGVDQVDIPIPPLICVPTTAGSSADVSQFAIISDDERKVKMAIVSKAIVPDLALIDPQTLTTKSPHLVACTGMDALTHAVEAYVSGAHSPVTDLHALEAVRLIPLYLQRAVSNPACMEAQGHMMLASLEAGLAFSNAILGAVHAMAHSLGGFYDLPHGECNAILLSEVIRFNYQSCPRRYDRIGEVMGLDMEAVSPERRAQVLVDGIAELLSRIGIAPNLRHLGIAKQDISRLADFAMRDACMATNPRMMNKEQVEAIYESIT